MYDVKKLLSQVTITDVCDYLGLRIYRRGRSARMDCPNPAHIEHHHDNCSLYEDAGRFCCFSCGEKGGIIDMIMLNLSCSFKDAVNTLAAIAGVDPDDPDFKKSAAKECIIRKSDQDFLGIENEPVYNLVGISDCYDSGCDKCEDMFIPNKYAYACFDKVIGNPLQYLFNTNPTAYRELIKARAGETLKYWEKFQNLTGFSAEKEINRALTIFLKFGGVYEAPKEHLLADSIDYEEEASLF